MMMGGNWCWIWKPGKRLDALLSGGLGEAFDAAFAGLADKILQQRDTLRDPVQFLFGDAVGA